MALPLLVSNAPHPISCVIFHTICNGIWMTDFACGQAAPGLLRTAVCWGAVVRGGGRAAAASAAEPRGPRRPRPRARRARRRGGVPGDVGPPSSAQCSRGVLQPLGEPLPTNKAELLNLVFLGRSTSPSSRSSSAACRRCGWYDRPSSIYTPLQTSEPLFGSRAASIF